MTSSAPETSPTATPADTNPAAQPPPTAVRRIFIARHGERLDFVDGAYRETPEGQTYPDDPPLTKRGEEQASSISEYLSKHARVTSVYTSPFRRCARTATLAAPHLKVRIEPGLCERLSQARYWQTKNGPIWRQLDQLKEVDINVEDDYESLNPYDFNFKAYPESTEELNARCQRTLRTIIETDDTDGDILVVGHISSVKALINTLCPNTIVYKQVPCKFSIFMFRRVEFSHLDVQP